MWDLPASLLPMVFVAVMPDKSHNCFMSDLLGRNSGADQEMVKISLAGTISVC